ncbi:MAG: carboxymuconolactone decarboxylase family protein [Rhodospirillaceae bacterium]|nr:carboxymuconolactone decarboxylase family protein [Rhodospirillaceae bacterium]
MKKPALVALTAMTMLCALPVLAEEPQARIPLVPSDTNDPILGPMFKGIRAKGGEPLNMHRTIGNAPKVFKAYAGLAFALRADAIVPRADRELIILRTTQLNGGDYEFVQHTPMGLSCGLSKTQIDGLAKWRDGQLFNERQRAVLAYADGMASDAGVDDATFAAMRKHFSPQEIVELTVTAGFYSAASRVTRALGIKLEPNAGKTAYGKC